MSSPDQDRQRNREIAENEANRQVVGDVRVSVWLSRSRSLLAWSRSASPGPGSTADNPLSDPLGDHLA
jgi:hypothetical protein